MDLGKSAKTNKLLKKKKGDNQTINCCSSTKYIRISKICEHQNNYAWSLYHNKRTATALVQVLMCRPVWVASEWLV